MDWIHCNKCFSQLEPGITLHLTSCGHMFCNNCLDNGVYLSTVGRYKCFNLLFANLNILLCVLGVKESTCIVCRLPCSIMKLVPDVCILISYESDDNQICVQEQVTLYFINKKTSFQMKPEIQDYFTDPEEIIKKTCEVLQFQRQHRRRLLSYLFQSVSKMRFT